MKSILQRVLIVGLVVAAVTAVAVVAQPIVASAAPVVMRAAVAVQQVAPSNVDASALAGFAGIVLSLLLSYAPKFGAWFNAQDSGTKVEITGALLLIVAGGIYGLGCAGWAPDFNLGVSCDRPGLVSLSNALISALIANQAAYLAFVKPFASTNPA